MFELEAAGGKPSDIMPILGWIFFKRERRVIEPLNGYLDINDRMFDQAKSAWTEGKVTDFHPSGVFVIICTVAVQQGSSVTFFP